jgi:hypothetical protein
MQNVHKNTATLFIYFCFNALGKQQNRICPLFSPSLSYILYLLSTVQFAVFLKLNFCGQTAENTVVFFI